MHLGAIADDVTGGTDLAGLLRRAGLDVVQTFDAPDRVPRADAVVVSLKIRTASVQAAVLPKNCHYFKPGAAVELSSFRSELFCRD